MIYDLLRPLNPVDHRVPGYKNLTFRPAYTTIHHTAGTNSLHICKYGRPDLPGPLCHVLIAKNGTVNVITDGYANHAGRCFEPYSNYSLVGVELENLGNGTDPYPDVQMHAAREVSRLLGFPAVGHKEICSPVGRKVDPSFDMHAFRADLGEEMSLTTDQNDKLDEIYTAVRRRDYNGDGVIDTPWLADAVEALRADVAALKNASNQSGGSWPSAEDIAKALIAQLTK